LAYYALKYTIYNEQSSRTTRLFCYSSQTIPQIIIPSSPANLQPITIHICHTNNNLLVFNHNSTSSFTLHLNFWSIFWPVFHHTLSNTPQLSSFKIYLNNIPDMKLPEYTNRLVKVPYSRLITECNSLITSKNFSISWFKTKDHQPPPVTLPITSTSIPYCFPTTFTTSPLINNSHATSITHWIKFVNYYTNLFDILLSHSATYKPSSFEQLETLIKANNKLKNHDQSKFKALSTFRTKLLANQLPTRFKLHKRYPTLYPDDLCPRCDAATEDLPHIFSCIYNKPLINKKKSKLESLIAELNPKSIKISDFTSNLKLTNDILLKLALCNFDLAFKPL